MRTDVHNICQKVILKEDTPSKRKRKKKTNNSAPHNKPSNKWSQTRALGLQSYTTWSKTENYEETSFLIFGLTMKIKNQTIMAAFKNIIE